MLPYPIAWSYNYSEHTQMSHFPLETRPGRIFRAKPGKRRLSQDQAGGVPCLPWKLSRTARKRDDPSPCLGTVGDGSAGGKREALQGVLLAPWVPPASQPPQRHHQQSAGVGCSQPGRDLCPKHGEERNSSHGISSLDLPPPRSAP